MTDEKSPSEKLAALTVDRLTASGLLRSSNRETLISKISAGKMSGADWKLEIDIASEKATNQ